MRICFDSAVYIYFFPTEKKLVNGVKIAPSCIICPTGQYYSEFSVTPFSSKHAQGIQKSGPGLGEGNN